MKLNSLRLSIVLISLFLVSCATSSGDHMIAHVSPTPTNYAWWLRTNFTPAGKQIRGIPVYKLNPFWVRANEFTKDDIPHELLFEDGFDSMEESKSSFSRTGDFNNDGIDDLVLVGVCQTITGKSKSFVAILTKDANGNWKKVFSRTLCPSQFVVLSNDSKTIDLWFCMECDDGFSIVWNTDNNKYEYKFWDFGE